MTMSPKTCGCAADCCDCCTGIEIITPESVGNRPGLDALIYRVGTHAAFLETMKARLTTMTVDVPGADGKSTTSRPLAELTTRDSGDFSIALLDSWATVADVLTFYQERIANEGYLRTATERLSILELARLVGYSLRPGVAASVFLAYLLDDNQSAPVTIPAGARSQSIPNPGEMPQSFETSEDFVAHAEWNNLQVRLTRPQNITLANALSLEGIFVAGTSTNLKSGDTLLFVFGDNGDPSVVRTIASVDAQFDTKRTHLQFRPVAAKIVAAVPTLAAFVAKLSVLVTAASSAGTRRLAGKAAEVLTQTYLELPLPPDEWAGKIYQAADGPIDAPVLAEYAAFATALLGILGQPLPPAAGIAYTDPSQFVASLLRPAKIQPAGRLQLNRQLGAAFKSGADSISQLLVNFAPPLRSSFYVAWANANVNQTPPTLKGIFAFHVVAPLFGANATKMVTYTGTTPNQPINWAEWPMDPTDDSQHLSLDSAYEDIQGSGYALIQLGEGSRVVQPVNSVQTLQRNAYGVSGKTTRLTLAADWRTATAWDSLGDLRSVLVHTQSEALTLVDAPVTEDVTLTAGDLANGKGIELDALHKELTSGRWIILSGERSSADIPGVAGVRASELLMVSGLRQDFDATLPGDKTRTTLLLATPTANSYKRETVMIYANVVKATHGETRQETLGNGDGSQAFQQFTLKQPPLTFVSAPNPSGADSTLEIFVNDVQWHEADTLAGHGPKDRIFVTKTGDDDKTTVTFGNGADGARLPTGQTNVKAVYRNGIGQPGNVQAEQISLLQTRPLGVKSVLNPLAASGGADRENRDQARENAPLAVMSLDRLVSVQDYADFSRTFAGIGKAAARKLSDGRRQLVCLTIAGSGDAPIDESSDLFQNLRAALRQFGELDLPVRIAMRELVTLVLSAGIRLAPDYQWEPVVTTVRATLLDRFGFQKRALGQPVLLSEIIAAIQATDGVEYVDVDAFGGVPEKKVNSDGSRELLTLDDISSAVQRIVAGSQAQNPDSSKIQPTASVPPSHVDVNVADFENGGLRPAQLALFTAAVPDTIILNQLS
jgi:predicted phage baseplate assembly protein